MYLFFRFWLSIATLALISAYPYGVFANIEISFSDSDITLSKAEPFSGDEIRVYARLTNSGDEDILGHVIFSDNNKQIGSPQALSIKKGSFDDVFIDWKVTTGEHKLEISAFDTNGQSARRNNVLTKTFSIDTDSDGDGVGDKIDTDDDNDGVEDSQEASSGTSPQKSDSDGDGVSDKVDTFPTDKTEWRDTNSNGVGDNKDTDADGDSLDNSDEIKIYGTNPLDKDSDGDGLNDGKEIQSKTNPNNKDTDGDGIIDSEDPFPLDASSWQAGFMNSIASFFKGRNYLYFILAIPVLLILYLLFKRKKRRR